MSSLLTYDTHEQCFFCFFFFYRPRAFTKEGTNVRSQNEAEGLLCQQINHIYTEIATCTAFEARTVFLCSNYTPTTSHS